MAHRDHGVVGHQMSGMLAQKDDMHAAIAEAHEHGKPSVCGGPYATALPQELEQAGADFLVLDEGEITIPRWLEDLDRGAKSGVDRASGEKPDMYADTDPALRSAGF